MASTSHIPKHKKIAVGEVTPAAAILFLLCLGITLSCTNGKKEAKVAPEVLPPDSLVQTYENEFFSVMCPQGWTAEWEDFETDNEGIAYVLDSLNVRGGSVELWSPDRRYGVKIVKSVSGWMNPNGTPRQWCELSQIGRQMEEDYIGTSEIIDSIVIDGYPASLVWFAYQVGNDTLMQDQYAIVPKKSELYYYSIKYLKDDTEGYYIGWKMLHTLRLKVPE